LWIVDGELSAGRVRNFELRAAPESASRHGEQPSVHADDDGEHIGIGIGDRPVLAYRYGVQPVPAGVDTIFRRGGFIHPLYSPGGQVLTRIQPPDHYHHYGIWNPWTHTEFEGRSVDFWNLGAQQGTVRPRLVLSRSSGAVAGGFTAVLDHVAFPSTSEETVAIREHWTVRVWNTDSSTGPWLIDFVSTLNPLDRPLKILAHRYQGFSLRATEMWNDANVTLRTSEGFGKDDANGTRARWVDVNGVSTTTAGTSGILFMTNPANHNYPEHLRVWPVGANDGRENVFVNLNPAQDRDWVLQPGHSYVLRYRMLVYEGRISEEAVNRYWSDFAEPPAVDVFPTGALEGARVLVYTRNGEGYVHDNIAASVAAIERMGAENGFTIDVTDDPEVFTADGLQRYDALVFSNTNNEAFTTDTQRRALQAYIRRGGGFVGIHSASGSERNWPWYFGLVGGTFVRHPAQQDFTVDVVDRSHPSTSFLPDRWEIADDECYYLRFLNPHIRVLLAADLTTVTDPDRAEFPGAVFGDAFPLAWYQEFDGGREWYTALGHRPEQYEDPMLQRHILGGIRWVVAGGRR
jgi:type 1 glutamine amidotransferase